MQDEDIIRMVLDGYGDAYSYLVDKYKYIVFDLCYKYTYDYNEAQDLSQEIFLKAYRKLYSFKNTASFSTWLYRVGVNTCIDWTRKHKKLKDTVSIDDEEYLNDLPSCAPIPEDMVVDNERREIVRNAVMKLPEKYRTVLVLYNYKNLSCSEIAKILGIPLKTVETRLYRAKKILREALLKPCNGGEYAWNAVR